MATVERFLSAVQNEGAGGESLLVSKVFTMCFLGFLMASNYVNILPASGRKHLNGVGAVILYTYVFNMLAPPPEGTFDIDEESLPLKSALVNDDSSPEQVPLHTQKEEVTLIDPNASKKWKIEDFLAFLYEKLKLKQILQPPIIASILAMVLGAVPFLKRLIFTPDAPLFFFTDSCIILGEAMIPCILLALGGNFVDGPGSSKLGFRTTALPDDKMFRFVLLLQHTMPTSVLSGAVANLRGCGREAAAVLFWVHIFAVFSMTGWMDYFVSKPTLLRDTAMGCH